VDAAVRSKTPWILKKLGDTQERQRRIEASRIEWRDGARFPFLGEPVHVVLDASAAGVQLETEAGGPPRVLRVGLPARADAAQIRDTVQAWLMKQAHQLFSGRLDHFAPRLGVSWRKLALSNAGTRWGTAHSDGTIRLNWRLVHFRLAVIDYVVAHELAHLRVMDHSPRFWDTVASVVPDYAALRGQLKDEALPPW
jgi:predicted metal-dependent hydrolase